MENKKIKILAIDDITDNLVILKAIIKEVFTNASVFTAQSGEEGIQIAFNEEPDVILLDIIMPEMDGYDVCKLIKSNEKLADIPVVFVTAMKADRESRIRALEAGGEGFITKPVDMAELTAQIRAMCTIRESRSEKRLREEQLSQLVEVQTRELRMTHKATLSLLDELKMEVVARKKSEAALRESEQRYKAFIDNSMDAILLTTPGGDILSANAAACEMFGREEEEFIALGRDCILEKTDQKYLDFFEKRKNAGKARMEIWLVRKNGEPFLAEISSAIYSPRPGELFSSMIIRDATQRVQAERTIENERLLLRTLINNIPDSIYCKDLSCRKTIANKTDIRYMGAKSEAEVIGKSDFEFYPKDMAERFYADDCHVLQSGQPLVNREELLIDEGGNKKWLLSSKLPLRDINNEVTGLVGIGRDITELKQREQLLRLQYNMAIAKSQRKSLQELFDGIRNDLEQLMEAENLTLAMLNTETGMLYSPVDYEDKTRNPDIWPAGKSLTGWVIKQKKSVILTCADLKKVVEREKLERFGAEAQCWMGVPLFDQGIAVGAIIMQSYKNQNAYNRESLLVVELVASQLISYMKRLEAEQMALKLAKAVEQSPDTIMITNTRGIIEYVNPKFTEHTGYSAEEAMGKTPAILSSGKHPKSYYQSIWKTLESGNDWSGEIMNRRKDGSLYWEKTSIAPLFSNGEVTHFISVKEEITEQKKTEAALKYHAELQSMLLKIASGYINVDIENLDDTIQSSLAEMGRFAAADRAYIFEYDWKKNQADNCYEWCDEGIKPLIKEMQEVDLDEMDAYVDALQKGEIVFVSEDYKINVNENLMSMLSSRGIKSGIGLPMMDGARCVGFVGFDWVRENHQYQEGEKVLLSIFSQLLVSVRLKSKLEHKLIVEKEKAEAASRLKTAFLNNISHEVRTPINGILGFSRMLMEPGLSRKEKYEYYDVLQDSCNRLIQTITSFMDMSLLTSGNMSVVRRKFSLHHFLNRLYRHYKNQNLNSQVELVLELNLEQDDLIIKSDEELLKKLFYHVLENAFKFTKEGQVALVCTQVENRIEFFINDTGIGIDPAVLDNIFEPFVQEDYRLSRGYEGSGLGLAISKGLVELLGGTLSVSSKKGKGTTVSFSIPYVPEGRQSFTAEQEQFQKPDAYVLIAEDDAVNMLYLQTVLGQEGITHMAVENGKLAVEACRKNRQIKVVLMDLKMPVMGGLEATRQIKTMRGDLAVIAVTAHAMKGDKEVAVEAGCDDYLPKPFNKDVLIKKIRFYLKDCLKGTAALSSKKV